MVENNSTAVFFSNIPRPKGPIITPDIISPTMDGIFNFFKRMGVIKIIMSTNENTNTGFESGNINSFNN